MVDATPALKECDLIMKGGITSGVVYPKAILEMSQHYRFRSIGGTSAGAIAAVITAAAEFNRDGNGYATIKQIPDEVQKRLLTLFQPSPELRPVFEAALLAMDGKYAAAFRRVFSTNRRYVFGPMAGAAMLAILAAGFGSYFGALLLLLIGAAIGVVVLAWAVISQTLRDLVRLDFGFCPGPTQDGRHEKGLSDWLAEKIEVAAGRMEEGGKLPERPLLFKDIWHGALVEDDPAQGTEPEDAAEEDDDDNEAADDDDEGTDEAIALTPRRIDLRMMTTNLSLRRPNALPSMNYNHYFKRDEFERLFPKWVVDYLVGKSSPTDPEGYCRFPVDGDMPLIVAARMSLSFPILFATVPLYRRDFPHQEKGGPAVMQRMLFSDGGLSSNFPMHFFDALLPSRPTFGISLEELDPAQPARRVHLSMKARDGMWLDHLPITTLTGFLMTLVNAAKDWQDRLQSTLPGYRERITSIYLDPDEGGLNLTMTEDQITALGDLGARAGKLMIGTPSGVDKQPFDLEDHRWRRYLVAFARLEETLQSAASLWNHDTQPTRAFIEGYMAKPRSYKRSSKRWRKDVFDRFDAIMTLASGWNGRSLRRPARPFVPKPATDMRITPIS